jgi:adhesin/invasin
MSKNLTRKGLALGAVVALGSSLFAGSPAFAIDPVSLAPTTGTTYTTILGETFSLTSQFTDAAQVANESLKWVITDSSDKLNIAASNGTSLASATRNATSHKIVIAGTNSYGAQALTLKAAATTDAFDVTVQAWMDYNADSVVDAGEASSAVQTVKFIKLANAGLTTTLSALAVGDTTAKATISFNSDVNVAQLTAADYGIAFGKLTAGVASAADAGSTFLSGAATVGNASTYDSTDKVLTKTVTLSAPAVAAIYEAVAVKSAAEVGSASFRTVAAAVATAVAAFKSTVGDNVSGSGSAFAVRSKVTTVTATSAVVKADGDDAGTDPDAAAGIAGVVTATYTPASGDTATTVTVGGKTLSATTTSVTFDAVSGADGNFSAVVVSSTGKVGSAVTLSVKVPGLSATAATTYTWTDATVTGLTDLISGTNAVRSIVKGGSVSIDYILVDSFGALVTADGYRVAVSAAGTGTDAVAANKFVSFVGGKATVSFTDGSTAAGTYNVSAQAQLASATTGNFGSAVASATSSVKVLAVANPASAVTANAATTASLETKAFVSGDKRVLGNALTVPAYTAGVAVTGDVTDVLGATVYGASVTVSAAGVLFTDGNVYSTGSITVNTDNVGHYSVTAYGTKAGKVTFTATSGAATKTVVVTFAAGIRANLKTTTVVAPATSQTGRAVAITATLVDTFGNAVSGVVVSFASTGVGSLSAATATTDDNGVASVKLVSQLGEDGDAVVTVTHGGVDTTITTDDFTLAKTITFGVTDAQVDIVSNRVTAVASYTKGKTVAFYVDGIKKWSKVSASDADVVLNYNLKKGTHTVTVKISGGFVTTEKFIVK